jgi:hypothetical protein
MANARYLHRNLDVACELDAAARGTRETEWRQLRESAGLGVEAIPGGARLWLADSAWDAAEELSRREAACCGFLDFDLAIEGDRVRLEVTSEAHQAQLVIAVLVGLDECSDPTCS